MYRLVTSTVVGASIKLSPVQQNEDSIYALYEGVDSMPTGTHCILTIYVYET